MYYELYVSISEASFADLFSFNTEPGFTLLTLLFSKFFKNFIFVNFAYSTVILVPIAVTILRHSKNIWLSCFIYISASLFYFSMNFTRQAIATSIILLSYSYIKEHEHIKVFFTIIIAALFHVSALLFLPVYFITLVKPTKRFYIALCLLAAQIYLLFEPFMKNVINYAGIRKNENYSRYIETFNTSGVSFFFLIIPLVFCCLTVGAYLFKWGEREETARFYAIISVVGLFVWILATKTILAECFAYYFMIFAVLALPSAAKHFIGDFREIGDFINKLKVMLFKQNQNKRRSLMRLRQIKLYSVFAAFFVLCLSVNVFTFSVYSSGNLGIAPYNSVINHIEYLRYSSLSEKDRLIKLRKENDMRDYLLKLKNPDFSYIITVLPDESHTITEAIRGAFKYIGLKSEFLSLKSFNKCFISVGKDGEIVYTDLSGESIEYFDLKLFGYEIEVFSSEDYAGVVINGYEYSLGNKGLNITVFNNNGVIVDKVSYTVIDGSAKLVR